MKTKLVSLLLFSFLALAPGLNVQAQVKCSVVLASLNVPNLRDLNGAPQVKWFKLEVEIATEKILKNISPEGAMRGAVIASPTRAEPNYFYHWVRDASLVTQALMVRYDQVNDPQVRNAIRTKLGDYIEFSTGIQKLKTLRGLGEPKFNVDGTAFNEPWARPQNDGPALRAISLMEFSKIAKDFNVSSLYDGNFPSDSPIKKDLEYIAHHWKDASWDLWEEVDGVHLYTRIVQRRALLDGAQFATKLGDPGAAEFYKSQADLIEKTFLRDFFDRRQNILIPTEKGSRVDGIDNKKSDVDMAVIFGLLHGFRNDGFIDYTNPKIISTLHRIETAFKNNYPINQNPEIPGLGIGRYPEDTFSGADRSGGNPWVITTMAMAEIYYRLALQVKNQSTQSLGNGNGHGRNTGFSKDPNAYLQWVAKGDTYVARVKFHANTDGSLNEQFRRDTGYMTSVRDLTWNYASILTAYTAREAVAGPIAQ